MNRTARRIGLAVAATVGVAVMGAGLAAPASAAAGRHTVRPAADCPQGTICFWGYANYEGGEWQWSPANGYRDLPPALHDHVGSFVDNGVTACFVNWSPFENRTVQPGDYRAVYLDDFGGRMDGVNSGAC